MINDDKPSRLIGKQDNKFAISFEFFPPKTDKMEKSFWESIDQLTPLHPNFISVTYGAGGSTRERTKRLVCRVKQRTGVPSAAHLTCVGATKQDVNKVVLDYKNVGINRIVALRGDPPGGIGEYYQTHPGGYENAADLVAGIQKLGAFDISVAAYPEKHPESVDWDADIDNLKRKIDAGANRAITQLFFDNDIYEAFLERCAKAGIDVPIVPGIQPIHNYKQIQGFVSKIGSSIPDWITHRFKGLDNDPHTHALVASATAAEQVMDLVDRGVTHFHFYTLNRSPLVLALAKLLGIRPT